MREIKFRAWDKEVTSYTLEYPASQVIVIFRLLGITITSSATYTSTHI